MTSSSASNSDEPLHKRLHQTRRMRRAIGGVVLATFLLPASVAGAVEYTAARKAGRGLAGMTCAFLEIPGNIVTETKEHGGAQGFALGLTLGLGHMVVRTLVGVFELVTSPFPVPDGFKPIIEPEFPWGYFDEAKP
jgi:putative exosortase-associated protein (TIGR04073 family)